MNQVMAWAGFLGAWLLVAGPLYQGAIELHEEDVDREAIEASTAQIPRPDPPSPWWWLLPPAMYVLRHRQGNAYRQAALDTLTPLQRKQFTRFVNKASGWFTVAIGATLIAAEQTWQIVEHYEWPTWLFWLGVVVMIGVCVLNTALRMIHDHRSDPSAAEQAGTGAPS
jgi:hypothetical protein